MKASGFTEKLFGEECTRIDDIINLWNLQFTEDESKKSHPLLLSSYTTPNLLSDNTATFKGKEVIHTLQTILNRLVENGFNKTLALLYERHSDTPVTHANLISCGNEVIQHTGETLTQFSTWFYQGGTPNVTVKLHYEEKNQLAKMIVTQDGKDPVSQIDQPPLPIPLSFEFMGAGGAKLLQQTNLILKKNEETFDCPVSERPIPVILDYNAPIHLTCDYELSELAQIMLNAKNPYTLWNGSRLYTRQALQQVISQLKTNPKLKDISAKGELIFPELTAVYNGVLQNPNISFYLKARLLEIPKIEVIAKFTSNYDFNTLKTARSIFTKQIALHCQATLLKLLTLHPEPETSQIPDTESMKVRYFRNMCLKVLAEINSEAIENLYVNYKAMSNFNNFTSAFHILMNINTDKIELLIRDLKTVWKKQPSLARLFMKEVASSNMCTLSEIHELEAAMQDYPGDPSLLFETFCMNSSCYHDNQGMGYRYAADKIVQAAKVNPLLACEWIQMAFRF